MLTHMILPVGICSLQPQPRSAQARWVGELGLYISKAIVEGHGGRIDVESAVDCGSSFTVRLPVQAD
jgi:signal transduction histidine kinase